MGGCCYLALNSQLTHYKFKVWMKTNVDIPSFHFNLFVSKDGDYADDKSVQALHEAGPRSAVGNVSGFKCVSDCRSRGR